MTDSLGTTTVVPLGEAQLVLDQNRIDDGRLTYTREVSGTIVFTGATYTRLLSIENGVDRCDPITLLIRRNCGGTFEDFINARFLLTSAEWDLYRCQVSIKFDNFEAEECFEKGKGKELNLLALVSTRYTANLLLSGVVIEKVTYQRTGDDHGNYWGGSGTPEAGAWSAYYNYQALIQTSTGFQLTQETRWARQKKVLTAGSPAPGLEWILAGTSGGLDTWVKPAILYDRKETATTFSGNVIRAFTTEYKIIGDGTGTVWELDNGMKLGACLQAFADQLCTGLTVKSEFFQINPDTTTATNYVTGSASKVRNVLVFQKSDVKRPAASGNATILTTTWEKFITQLVETYNVRWRVVGSVLRVEHVSWFPQTVGFDLTTPEYSKFVLGLEKYTYKTEQIPGKETFKFKEAGPGGDFPGVPIYYEGGCVSAEGSKNEVSHTADEVTTDVQWCMENSASDSAIVDDKGMVFVACDSSNNILSEPPILSALTRLNNTLAWAQLHRDYHRHYRLLGAGNMNGSATSFLSVKPLKKGAPLTIPYCCGDTFDPNNAVNTALGLGIVEKASFNFKSDTLRLELLYPHS
jgi:hypothetical protein